MGERERIPVTVPIQPHLADHRFEGRAVFPAVEALQLMAGLVSQRHPHVPVCTSSDARFLRFLPVPVEAATFEAIVELEPVDGGVTARLLTQARMGAGGMARLLEHAVVTFGPLPEPPLIPPSFLAAPLGPGLAVRSADLYGAMVPFGPAYHNARDPIVLAPGGATGRVVCPKLPFPPGPLGSPFPFDAAFHLGCGWGERYVGAVLFPVGYESRHILVPTEPGGEYLGRVVPRDGSLHAPAGAAPEHLKARPSSADRSPAHARFDFWIFDSGGRLCEVCFGVRMEDVSRGRFVPPAWGRWDGRDPLEPLCPDVAGIALVELAAVLPPLARRSLTPVEQELAAGLGDRRRPSFIAARVALKQLARQTSRTAEGDDRLHTVAQDSIRPVCPAAEGRMATPFCSVAHDRRFAVAVAAHVPIGVDLEPIADKAVRGMRLFLSEEERRLVREDPRGVDYAATCLWTIKEAAAKALNIRLPHAWHAVEAVELLAGRTRVRVNGHELTALHAEVDGHLLTTLCVGGGEGEEKERGR